MLEDYMPMSTITGSLALFFIIWWTTLFAILPFWVRSQSEDVAKSDIPTGTEPGAPQHPRLLRKVLVNTAVSIVLFIVVSIIVNNVDL
jgi:predicted secreted protein